MKVWRYDWEIYTPMFASHIGEREIDLRNEASTTFVTFFSFRLNDLDNYSKIASNPIKMVISSYNFLLIWNIP